MKKRMIINNYDQDQVVLNDVRNWEFIDGPDGIPLFLQVMYGNNQEYNIAFGMIYSYEISEYNDDTE